MPTPACLALPAVALAALSAAWVLSVQPGTPAAKPYDPKIFPPSDAGLKAPKRIRPPKGLRVDLVAAEPLLANPVAFCIDEKGRFYVAETFRLHAGVTDNRNQMGRRPGWLDDDLAARTVADRLALYRKHLGR